MPSKVSGTGTVQGSSDSQAPQVYFGLPLLVFPSLGIQPDLGTLVWAITQEWGCLTSYTQPNTFSVKGKKKNPSSFPNAHKSLWSWYQAAWKAQSPESLLLPGHIW